MPRDREEFTSDQDYQAHLEHEVEAAQLRGDEDEEAAARRALAGEHGQKAAVKRPRAAANKEER